MNIIVRCPDNSPLQITSPNATDGNFILQGGVDNMVSFTPKGNQGYKLGGSQAWTYLENINWITGQQSLTITSSRLENVTGNNGTISGAFQLNTPNVNNVSLTSAGYSGTVSLIGRTNYPNLETVNISNSKLALTLRDLYVTEVNMNNVNTTGDINISNCEYLKTLTYTNLQASTLVMSVSETLFNARGRSMTFDSLKVESYNISYGGGYSSSQGGEVYITNDSTVKSITVQGFRTIRIANCPKLQNVVITVASNVPVI